MKLFSKLLILASVIYFIYFFLLLSFSSLPMNEFDGVLRLLSHYYTSIGLIPYKDFGVVYPPGYFLLLGAIIKYSSIFQRNLMYGIFYFFIFFIYIKLYIQNINRDKYFIIKTSIFIISLTLVMNLFFYYDLLTILIFPIFLITSGSKHSKILWFVYPIFFLLPFIRWDFALIVLLISLISIVSRILLSVEELSTNFFQKIIFCISFGFIALYLYLIKNSAVTEGVDFFVNIPTFVIKQYRNLPIPQFRIRPLENMMFHTTAILFLSFFFQIFKNLKLNNLKIKYIIDKHIIFISILLLLSLLPYTFGRISFHHTIPIWYLLIISYLFIPLKFNNFSIFAIALSFIPFITFYKNNINNFIPRINYVQNYYSQNAIECEAFSSVNAGSVFIGRTSYDYFDYSNAYLYYLYKHLRPATSYISDEPGIQDSCKYGEIINNQLATSKKPMLAFLATNDQTGFLNNKLRSCGKIESYLSQIKYDILGNCSSYGLVYEVRLYQ